MNCKSCGSVLHYINTDEGIVQCPNCKKKYRVKKPASNNMNSFSQNQDWTKQMSNMNFGVQSQPQMEQRQIDITREVPFSSTQQQQLIESKINEILADDLDRTFTDDLKSKIIKDNTDTIAKEPQIQDYQNAQDVNDVIKEYEHENYPETRPIQEKIFCSSCGSAVDLKTGECPECHNTMPLPPRKVIECPFCHYEKNNVNSAFCIKCGKDLEPERERLEIKLEKRTSPREKQQVKSSSNKDKDEKDTQGKASFGRILFNLICIGLLGAQGYIAYTMTIIKSSDNSFILNFENLFKIIQNIQENETLLGIIKGFTTEEIATALVTKNKFLLILIGIAIVVMLASMLMYILSSLIKIITGKISKSVGTMSVLNFVSNLVFTGILEYMLFSLCGALSFGMYASIINLGISSLVMFISFLIM